MSDSLRPHGLQQTKLPCPSPSPRVMPSNHLVLCHPLLLPPLILSSIGVFSNVSALCIRWPKYWSFNFTVFLSIQIFSNESALCIRWPKYWRFSLTISPSNEYSELISFRIDWFDLLAVQGTLKSLLQHHSSKASILQHSAFFMVQLSYPYMTTGKTIALTI